VTYTRSARLREESRQGRQQEIDERFAIGGGTIVRPAPGHKPGTGRCPSSSGADAVARRAGVSPRTHITTFGFGVLGISPGTPARSSN
jgi:hypothetical protein